MSDLLTAREVVILRTAHRNIKDRRICDRIKALLSLNDGVPAATVAKVLLWNEVTVRKYLKKFKQKGISGLFEMRYKGGFSKLTSEQEFELKRYLTLNTKRTVKEITAYIAETYKINYSVVGATKLLHRLGFTYKKPKVVPGKADFLKQKEFVETYKNIKENLRNNDQIYFVDSTHPEHNNKPSYGWILKGKENDKYIKTNTGRERLNLAGALDLNDKKAIILSQKTINKFSTIKLIKRIEKSQSKGKIYLILDNASYHHAKVVKNYIDRKGRIKLIFLPPYSPNLNPIERLWKFFHAHLTWNRYFETFKEFKSQTLKFFGNLDKYQKELETLLTDSFQLVPT